MELTNSNKILDQMARKMGAKNASILLGRLGENKQFINAIETPVGREIISLVVKTIEEIVENFLKTGITESEWNQLYPKYLELQASLKFHVKVIHKINTYNSDREKFNKATGE